MSPTESSSARTATRSVYLTRIHGFIRTQLWVWPLIVAVVLAFVGLWLRVKLEDTMRAQVGQNLQTILNANTQALRFWSDNLKSQAKTLADDATLRDLVQRLEQRVAQRNMNLAALLAAPEQAALREHLKTALTNLNFDAFAVMDSRKIVLAASREHVVGIQAPAEFADQLAACLGGAAVVTRPFPTIGLAPGAEPGGQSRISTIFAGAPVHAADGKVIAVLALRTPPDKEFSEIVSTARVGDSGETYAFNRNGVMLSMSRFEDEIKRIGLIPDAPDQHSILTLELRDPLADLTAGRQSPKRRAELGFTRAVSAAIAGQDGSDVSGYRDYRGVPVVGAWRWLKEFDMGLVTEMDVADAFRPLRMVRMAFWSLFAMLALTSAIVYGLMRMARRLESAARSAALKAKQLGQYTLDDKIGAGSCGTVFRAHHALMRRPVAVKLLEVAQEGDVSALRFEREVQLTSQLSHPNTISLYDYGRTPEGIFYYAMEHLDGLTLDRFVKSYGRQPEGRVIFILRQVCGSLSEAHEIGLVHRDIKPANVFLTRRGGVADFVKVLDFGLVKARDTTGQANLTGASATLGTPMYMSPEAVVSPEKVDARSDLYSLGAVAYFLLTSEPIFESPTIGEILMDQVKKLPARPSARIHQPIAADLEELVMRCLAKNPDERPASAREMEHLLAICRNANDWKPELAEAWWRKHLAIDTQKTVADTTSTAKTVAV